jgi:hypothetical protein
MNPNEATNLRDLDRELTCRHPDLAQAFDRWMPPPGGARAKLRRLRALGPLPCTVLLLLGLALLWLYGTIAWACL